MMPASNVALGAPAFPNVDNESIVINALVDLLQGITMVVHENDRVEQSVQWSTRPAAFALCSDSEPLYVAQVDGHLTKSPSWPAGKRRPSKIILEVEPTLRSPLCSYGRGSQTAKHIIIHCSMFAAARHQLRDDQGCHPDYKQLLTTPEGL